MPGACRGRRDPWGFRPLMVRSRLLRHFSQIIRQRQGTNNGRSSGFDVGGTPDGAHRCDWEQSAVGRLCLIWWPLLALLSILRPKIAHSVALSCLNGRCGEIYRIDTRSIGTSRPTGIGVSPRTKTLSRRRETPK